MFYVMSKIRSRAILSDHKCEEGFSSLQKVADTSYLFFVQLEKDSIAVDIDDVTGEDKYQMFILDRKADDEPDVRVFIFEKTEYDLLKDCIIECRNICSLTLRMNSLVRDVFFSGVYSTLEKESDVNLLAEIEEIKRSDPMSYFTVFSLAGASSAGIDNSCDDDEEDSTGDSSAPCCFYCGFTNSEDAVVRNFVIHPYVPVDVNRNKVLMCIVCIENWREYREDAAMKSELVLDNEVNEEICCVCSDVPEVVTMCSSCPRSFCFSCLEKLLDERRLQELLKDSESDWMCVSCCAGVDVYPRLSREAWRYYRVPSQSKLTRKRPVVGGGGQGRSRGVAPSPNASSSSSTAVVGRASKLSVMEPPDEAFYFSQYFKNYDKMCRECKQSVKIDEGETEDACFLCKDGGDLVECDWIKRGKRNGDFSGKSGRKQTTGKPLVKCKKVYHECCLSYGVSDANVEWFCPRHYCDSCGSVDIKFACLFCPVSVCENCPEDIVKKFGLARYIELSQNPPTGEFDMFAADAQAIICQSCIEMIRKGRKKGLIPTGLKLAGKEKRFPGVPDPDRIEPFALLDAPFDPLVKKQRKAYSSRGASSNADLARAVRRDKRFKNPLVIRRRRSEPAVDIKIRTDSSSLLETESSLIYSAENSELISSTSSPRVRKRSFKSIEEAAAMEARAIRRAAKRIYDSADHDEQGDDGAVDSPTCDTAYRQQLKLVPRAAEEVERNRNRRRDGRDKRSGIVSLDQDADGDISHRTIVQRTRNPPDFFAPEKSKY